MVAYGFTMIIGPTVTEASTTSSYLAKPHAFSKLTNQPHDTITVLQDAVVAIDTIFEIIPHTDLPVNHLTGKSCS
jgi:hypothetical protein